MAKKTEKAEAASGAEKKSYVVLYSILFAGKVQERRAVLQMTDEEASGPLKSGYIKQLPARD